MKSADDDCRPEAESARCHGYTTRRKRCWNRVPQGEFCGRCEGSSNRDVAHAKYSSDEVDESEMLRLARHPNLDVRSALAHNDKSSLAVLRILAQDDDDRIRRQVAQRKELEPADIDILTKDSSEHVRSEIASHKKLTQQQMATLAKDSQRSVRNSIAGRKDLPMNMVKILLSDSDDRIVRRALYSVEPSSMQKDDWRKLVEHPSEHVHYAAIRNRAVPRSVLSPIVAKGSENILRFLAVSRPGKQIVAQLAQRLLRMINKGESVLSFAPALLAQENNVSSEALGLLAEAPSETLDSDTWWRLARHPNASAATVCEVIRKGRLCPRHLRDLLRQPACDSSVLNSIAEICSETAVLQDIARHQAVSAALLRQLVSSRSMAVVADVCANRATPPECLAVKSKSKSAMVRRRVAENPAIPADALAGLADDNNVHVRSGLANNPSCPQDAIAALAQDSNDDVRRGAAGNPNCSHETMAVLVHDDDRFVRFSLAANRAAAQEIIEMLAADESAWVREQAARHHAVASSTLVMMAVDSDQDVAAAAAETLQARRYNGSII